MSKNQLIFNVAQDVNEICVPLKKHLGILHFGYNKLFNDGAEIDLGTCPDMIQNYREDELHQYSIYGAHPENYNDGFVVWSHVQTHSKILEARERFQINDGITIIKKSTDSVEFFHFETAHENQNKIVFYLNNIDLLNRFTQYFKQKSAKLIASAEKNKFYITCNFSEKEIPIYNDKSSHQKFLKEISLTHDVENTLSPRLKESLYFLVKGMTIKQIAAEMNLSPKTIEHYLENAKNKLNCHKKSELIQKVLQFSFIKMKLLS